MVRLTQADPVVEAIRSMQADQVGRAHTQLEQYIRKSRQSKHNRIYGIGEWGEGVDVNGQTALITRSTWTRASP